MTESPTEAPTPTESHREVLAWLLSTRRETQGTIFHFMGTLIEDYRDRFNLPSPADIDPLSDINLHIDLPVPAIPGYFAYISEPRECDICKYEGTQSERESPARAEFDFKTIHGPWANACNTHYMTYRMFDDLGVGKGQRLIVHPDIVSPVHPSAE